MGDVDSTDDEKEEMKEIESKTKKLKNREKSERDILKKIKVLDLKFLIL